MCRSFPQHATSWVSYSVTPGPTHMLRMSIPNPGGHLCFQPTRDSNDPLLDLINLLEWLTKLRETHLPAY